MWIATDKEVGGEGGGEGKNDVWMAEATKIMMGGERRARGKIANNNNQFNNKLSWWRKFRMRAQRRRRLMTMK